MKVSVQKKTSVTNGVVTYHKDESKVITLDGVELKDGDKVLKKDMNQESFDSCKKAGLLIQ